MQCFFFNDNIREGALFTHFPGLHSVHKTLVMLVFIHIEDN